MTRFWIGVVSKEHVLRGVEGGFCQVCHGKKAPLNRMKKGGLSSVLQPQVSAEWSGKAAGLYSSWQDSR